MKKYPELQPDDIRRMMNADHFTDQECEAIIDFTKQYSEIVVSVYFQELKKIESSKKEDK
jgi:hypothetical protein